MMTNKHFWLHLSQIVLEWKNISGKSCRKKTKKKFYVQLRFFDIAQFMV